MPNSIRTALTSAIILSTLGVADFASAQDPQTYQPEYFDSYAPRTAQDMVSRIPGFQVQNSESRRGLGQGGVNVLINGERMSGKSSNGGQLGRIVAKNVVRIEILDGASLDIPGLSGRVANIITKNSGVSGSWSWAPQFRKRMEPNFGHIHFTVSGEKENLAYSLELRNEHRIGGSWGPEFLTQADGTTFERREEIGRSFGETPGALLDLTWTPKENHIGNLNLEYNQANFNGLEHSQRTALTNRGVTQETKFSNAEDEWNAKVGGDYEFPFAAGKLKTIGYYRAEHSPTVSRFDIFEPNIGLVEGSRFIRVADEGEAIARTEYSWKSPKNYDWQLGIEGAFNFLDIESKLLEYNGADYAEAPLDGATSKVKEKRAESTLTHSRPLSPKWDIQASIGAEYSELSQTNGLKRNFFRPKGFVTATYKPNENLSIRSKIEREVGQLNFFDFISSVSLDDNQNSAGNVNLVPSQSWNGEVEFDRDFGQGNTLKIRFYGELISDLVDRIPIGLDGDAIGNIDKANRYGIDADLTLKGEKWGLNGVEIAMRANYRDSNLDDPLTSISRRLNGDEHVFTNFRYRHDVENTAWAYGFYAGRRRTTQSYRLNSINEFKLAPGWGEVFIEHKDVLGMKVVTTIENLFSATEDLTRDIYTDRRDIGILDYTESRSRAFKPIFTIEFSGTF
ncbi:MAG: TonB-dependent receptor plug domain-containing protein [Maricaulaceae bacterium]